MGNYNGKATSWPLSAVIIQCMHSEETGELYEARFLNPRGLLCVGWLVLVFLGTQGKFPLKPKPSHQRLGDSSGFLCNLP